MTDLHTRLDTAVRARLEVARAANGPTPWVVVAESWEPWADIVTTDADGDECEVVNRSYRADVTHIAANEPTTVIRHCEADLRRLARHTLVSGETEAAGLCDDGWHDSWPCDEIRDLAAAYGVSADE